MKKLLTAFLIVSMVLGLQAFSFAEPAPGTELSSAEPAPGTELPSDEPAPRTEQFSGELRSRTQTSEYKEVSGLSGFQTVCRSEYNTAWSDADGLYILLGNDGMPPYLILNVYPNMDTDAETFLEDIIHTVMVQAFGDNLISSSAVDYFEIDGRRIPVIQHTVNYQGTVLRMLNLSERSGSNIISYGAAFAMDDAAEATTALELAIKNFSLNGAQIGPEDTGTGNRADLPPVSYTAYSDPDGWFTMDIPTGWAVRVGVKPDYSVDLICFGITVYDPSNPDRQLYINLSYEGVLFSKEVSDWHKTYYPLGIFAAMPYAVSPDADGIFQGLSSFLDYRNFQTVKVIGYYGLNGTLLIGNAVSTLTGNPIEGMFLTELYPFHNYVKLHPESFYDMNMLDAGFYTLSNLVTETAPAGELEYWLPVLTHCAGTLEYSQSFKELRERHWRLLGGAGEYILTTGEEISNMILDVWRYNSQVGSETTQKFSDAILG